MTDETQTTQPATPAEPTFPASYVKELREEAANRRHEVKSLTERIEAMQSELGALKAQPKPDTQKGSDDANAIQSELKAKLQELQQRLEKSELESKQTRAEAKQKMLRANLVRILSDAKVLDVDAAVTYLEARGAKLTDEDRTVIDVLNELGDRETVSISGETLRKHKVLTDHWFPPVGVGGSGSTAPRMAPAGVDLERAKKDPAYFAEHAKEIAEHQRAKARPV